MSSRTVRATRVRAATRTDNVSDLLQVLSVIAMERPVSFAAEDIRDEKVHNNA